MKKVLLVVIDALSSIHVQKALQDGKLPTFARLIEHGQHTFECISIFPSITPAATASIITGQYPKTHGIPGAFFYNKQDERVYYFGTDIWNILREGIGEFFNDFVIRLNEELLSSPTLFEIAEQHELKSAALNYLIIRGPNKHIVDVPWLLRVLPGVPWREEINGPNLLCMGDFVTSRPRESESPLAAQGGVFNRFGFQDATTAELLFELAEKNAWRDLTVAYFPDNDFESHENGPATAVSTLEQVDQNLGDLIEKLGGLEQFLSQFAVIITGDHSQNDLVSDNHSRRIEVDDLLKEFELVPAGAEWTNDHQLMVCPNMRACQVYWRKGFQSDRSKITELLLADHRIDQVIWRGKNADMNEFHVAKADCEPFVFSRVTDGNYDGIDVFENRWQLSGSLDSVDATVSDSKSINYGEYPNALERIEGSFVKTHGGDMWVTAKPGYEFALPDETTHDSGAHGSLHLSDSLSPLIVAGADEFIKIESPMRTIDVANICLAVLGLNNV